MFFETHFTQQYYDYHRYHAVITVVAVLFNEAFKAQF